MNSAREPIFQLPSVIVIVVALLAIIHIGLVFMGEEQAFLLIEAYGFVPLRFSVWLDGKPLDIRPAMPEISVIPTFLTYAFLHGSWLHLGFNSIWLAIFGTPLVRRWGTGRFVVLFGASTIFGALAYWIVNSESFLPMIGASGAVSGLTGAASRFVFQRNGQTSLAALFGNVQAMAFIGLWLILNVLFGLFAPAIGLVETGIAWEAHLGGFAAGFILFMFLDRSNAISFKNKNT